MTAIMSANLRNKSAILPPPFKPYDWQIPIIKVIVDTILAGENGLVIQPTATGKSVEAAFTARSCILLRSMKGLYLYDENEGLEQARDSFKHIFGKNEITCADFFGYGKDNFVNEADMVFASFQSLNNHHNKWYTMFDTSHFDFMIVNEAHCGQAVTYKEVIDYFNCPKIGMTATPKRMDKKDILEIFHKIIFDMPLEEAIVKKRVSGIEYHIKSHGLSTKKINEICKDVLEEGKRVSIKQLNETIFIDLLDDEVLKEIYSYAFPEGDRAKQTLLFCENIAHANRMGELLKKAGMSVAVIHSKLGKTHNREALKQFRKSNIQFLVSVNKLNEDIDVPNVQVVAFLRSTDSETIFFQQLGRGLRKLLGKDKLIVLDFVGNCDRLITIKQMKDKVLEFAEEEGIDFSDIENNPFNVSGDGFSFEFSDQVVDVLKMISAIREGFYETWQEASAIAIHEGLRGWNDCRLYSRKDKKFPACPSDYYENFPGWKIFLNKKSAPEGWLSFKEIGLLYDIHHISIQTIKKFVEKHDTDLVFQYWQDSGENDYGRYVIFYHPELAKKIGLEFKGRKPPPGGWETANIIARSYNLLTSATKVKKFVEDYRLTNPEWFGFYLSKSAYMEHYHPELIKKFFDYIGVRQNPPEGWETAKVICKKNKWSLSVYCSKVNHFSISHPEWFGKFWLRGRKVEFYHPDFIKCVEPLMISKEDVPSPGWQSLPSFVGGRKTVMKFIEGYRLSNPEWFKSFSIAGGQGRSFVEYLHPELVIKIREHLLSLKFIPEGWMTCYQLGLKYGQGIKWTRIKKMADLYREKNPEWFKLFRAGMLLKEHYHPELIALIRLELDQMELPPEGWMTAAKISKLKGVRNSFNQIKKFVESFRSKYPLWFKSYITNNVFIEHYHPDLVQKIKEHFGKK